MMSSIPFPDSYMDFLYFLQDMEISECNGNFQRLVFERVTAYCDLLSKTFDTLTLGEFKSIVDACTCEFNFKEAA